MRVPINNLRFGAKQLRGCVALGISAALVAAACASNDEGTAEPPPSPQPTAATASVDDEVTEPTSASSMQMASELLVGYVFPSTGTLAHIGVTMIKAVEMARDEINAAGGNIRLLPGDSATMAQEAGVAADSHIADGVSAILGAAASGVTLSIIDKVTGAGVVMISGSNTSPSLTDYPDDGYYFRTIPSDTMRTQLLGDLVTDDGVSDAAIVYRADDYGRNMAQLLKGTLVENGVNVSISISYDPIGSSFDAEVQQVLEAGVDGVVLISFSEGAKLIASLIEVGMGPDSVPLFLGNGIASGTLWEDVNPANPAVLLGTKAFAPATAPEVGEVTFPERFRNYAGYDIDLQYSTTAYDSLVILALAALLAGSTEAADYAGEITGVTRDGTKCESYEACAALIASGIDIDYDGASGPLEFSEAGEPTVGNYDIVSFNEQGELLRLEQVFIEDR